MIPGKMISRTSHALCGANEALMCRYHLVFPGDVYMQLFYEAGLPFGLIVQR